MGIHHADFDEKSVNSFFFVAIRRIYWRNGQKNLYCTSHDTIYRLPAIPPEFMMWIGKIKFCSWRRRRRGEVRTVQVGQIDERKWHPDWCMFWTPGDFPFPITNKPLHYIPPNFRLLKITKCFSFCCCHFRSVCLREMFKVESFCKMTFKCSRHRSAQRDRTLSIIVEQRKI